MDDKKLKSFFRWKELEGQSRRYFFSAGASPLSDGDKKEFLEKVFGDLAQDYRRESILARCRALWEDIAGPLARHSWPTNVRGKKLVIRAEKSVYAQEISLYSSILLQALKKIENIDIEEIYTETGVIPWTGKVSNNPDLTGPPLSSDTGTEGRKIPETTGSTSPKIGSGAGDEAGSGSAELLDGIRKLMKRK